jgi:hypothetical protein
LNVYKKPISSIVEQQQLGCSDTTQTLLAALSKQLPIIIFASTHYHSMPSKQEDGNEESGGPNSLGQEYSLSDIWPMSDEYARAWGSDELQVSLCQAGTSATWR